MLLLSLGLGTISTAASHLRMLAAGHLSIARSHLLLLILAAHTHLLLVMLRIHLLLPTHLLIHGILAVNSAYVFGSFIAHPGLVSPSVLVVAVKIFSLAFFSGVLSPSFFAVFFTTDACSLTLMFSHLPRFVFPLSCSSLASSANTLSALALARAFALAIVFSHFPWLVFILSCSGSLALTLG